MHGIDGNSINFYYTGVLFDGEVMFTEVLGSAVMMMIFFMFIIALLLFVSSLVRRGIIAGLIVLVATFIMPAFSNIGAIKEYLPYYLVQRATDVGNVFNGTTTPAIIITITAIALLNVLTIYRMRHVEVV